MLTGRKTVQTLAPHRLGVTRRTLHHDHGTLGKLGGESLQQLADLLVRHGVGRVNKHQIPRTRGRLHVGQRLRLLHARHRTGSARRTGAGAPHRLLHRGNVLANHRNSLRVRVQQRHGGCTARERLAAQRARAAESVQHAGAANNVVALQLGEEGFLHPVGGGASIIPRNRGKANASGGTGNNTAHRSLLLTSAVCCSCFCARAVQGAGLLPYRAPIPYRGTPHGQRPGHGQSYAPATGA